jgi:hypothetical protein
VEAPDSLNGDPVRYLFGDPIAFLCQWLTQLDPATLTTMQLTQLRTSLNKLTSKIDSGDEHGPANSAQGNPTAELQKETL